MRSVQGNLGPLPWCIDWAIANTSGPSYLLCGLLSAEQRKKNGSNFQYPLVRVRVHVPWTETNPAMLSKPGVILIVIEKMVRFSQCFFFIFAPVLVAFTSSQLKRAVEPRKRFIMPSHYKKLLPAQQPLR